MGKLKEDSLSNKAWIVDKTKPNLNRVTPCKIRIEWISKDPLHLIWPISWYWRNSLLWYLTQDAVFYFEGGILFKIFIYSKRVRSSHVVYNIIIYLFISTLNFSFDVQRLRPVASHSLCFGIIKGNICLKFLDRNIWGINCCWHLVGRLLIILAGGDRKGI